MRAHAQAQHDVQYPGYYKGQCRKYEHTGRTEYRVEPDQENKNEHHHPCQTDFIATKRGGYAC